MRKLLATRTGVPPGGCAVCVSLSWWRFVCFCFLAFWEIAEHGDGFCVVCFCFWWLLFLLLLLLLFPGLPSSEVFLSPREEEKRRSTGGPTRRTPPANVNLVCFFVWLKGDNNPKLQQFSNAYVRCLKRWDSMDFVCKGFVCVCVCVFST